MAVCTSLRRLCDEPDFFLLSLARRPWLYALVSDSESPSELLELVVESEITPDAGSSAFFFNNFLTADDSWLTSSRTFNLSLMAARVCFASSPSETTPDRPNVGYATLNPGHSQSFGSSCSSPHALHGISGNLAVATRNKSSYKS